MRLIAAMPTLVLEGLNRSIECWVGGPASTTLAS